MEAGDPSFLSQSCVQGWDSQGKKVVDLLKQVLQRATKWVGGTGASFPGRKGESSTPVRSVEVKALRVLLMYTAFHLNQGNTF